MSNDTRTQHTHASTHTYTGVYPHDHTYARAKRADKRGEHVNTYTPWKHENGLRRKGKKISRESAQRRFPAGARRQNVSRRDRNGGKSVCGKRAGKARKHRTRDKTRTEGTEGNRWGEARTRRASRACRPTPTPSLFPPALPFSSETSSSLSTYQ